MSNFLKRILAYGIIVLLFAATFIIARRPIAEYATSVISFVKEYSNAHEDVIQELRQEIFSKPLRGNISNNSVSLSPAEIIKLTNNERSMADLYPLKENFLLDQAANRKLQDMFDRQYFEHLSPDGKGPGSLATQVGYNYIVIGENLALGTFKNNQDLVNAWMASQGHRENILNQRYMEIGVAVGHGMFNGQKVWLAVQEFGKPLTSCPIVSTALKSKIDSDKEVVSKMTADITARRSELNTFPHTTVEESTAYNDKVSQYNTLVSQYNVVLANLSKEIDTYNQSVREFNICARQ